MPIAAPSLPATFAADPVLLKAITSAVDGCLTMCDTKVRCVGVSTVPTREPGSVTGMIGLHGDVSGFITVNMAEAVALGMVAGLLQEPLDHLTSQVIDGVGEITNMIAGGIKKGVLGSPWGFSHLTIPSVIIGQNYQIAYAGGLNYLSATFEHQNQESLLLNDRLLQVAISLIRL